MSPKAARLGYQVAFAMSLLVIAMVCRRNPVSGLKGQSNVTTTFYGKVVDQDGAPLPNVAFQFRLEAYPKDWTFDTRGRDNDVTIVNAVSDANGLFQLKFTGCAIIMLKAEANGYRQLQELDGGTHKSNGWNSVFTRVIHLISWSDQQYKPDAEHPAVYVFVKNGSNRVKALPCQGGFRAWGKQWIENKAEWPFKPSLPDVDWADGQARVNVDVPLVIKAVDADGRPLANVGIHMELERYRSL